MRFQLRPRTTPKATLAPLSIAPSQAFQSNDGPWSTFPIRVGTPEQVFEVLISTASQETWIPVPQGCVAGDPSDCGSQRGALPFNGVPSNGFDVNASSTWEAVSLFELSLDSNLNYTGNGAYGYDTVGLTLPQSGGPTLTKQVVAGIADKSFYLGMFGLGPKPTNFTDFQTSSPSYFWSLRNQSLIPSLTWAYTAGAFYRLKQVPGSLTFGGYDSSRFTPNDVSFTFAADDSKPLMVGLQTIAATNTFQGMMSLLPSGILAHVDSTVPEMWLPIAACLVFETAFGLTYDEHTDRYLVNDTVHANLTSLNPVVTLKLGNAKTGGDTTSIVLPYAAFDLQASYPIYENATNYFPLRRASEESQYTLGRVFLQEAYLIADFDRGNFSLSQCVFKDPNPSTIVAIQAPSSSSPPSTGGLSHSALIGIIVGAVVLLLLLATGTYIFFLIRKKRRATAQAALDANIAAASGLGIIGSGSGIDGKREKGGEGEGRENRVSELMAKGASERYSELVGSGEAERPRELDAHGNERQRRSELPSPVPGFPSPVSSMPVEMEAEVPQSKAVEEARRKLNGGRISEEE